MGILFKLSELSQQNKVFEMVRKFSSSWGFPGFDESDGGTDSVARDNAVGVVVGGGEKVQVKAKQTQWQLLPRLLIGAQHVFSFSSVNISIGSDFKERGSYFSLSQSTSPCLRRASDLLTPAVEFPVILLLGAHLPASATRLNLGSIRASVLGSKVLQRRPKNRCAGLVSIPSLVVLRQSRSVWTSLTPPSSSIFRKETLYCANWVALQIARAWSEMLTGKICELWCPWSVTTDSGTPYRPQWSCWSISITKIAIPPQYLEKQHNTF